MSRDVNKARAIFDDGTIFFNFPNKNDVVLQNKTTDC